ncbi:MAG: HAMP domain-containing protein [Ignavibacteriae bacterium]|nr:HAMP domain-containing protein [Ignavibacteriota bacterium]MCB9216887.1 HAMP domain-containing protein [Ignavibacteria bacterium]
MFTTLRSKIFAGFGAVIAVNIVFTLWAIYNFSSIGERVNERVAVNYRATSGSHLLTRSVANQFLLLTEVAEVDWSDSLKSRFNIMRREFLNGLDQLANEFYGGDSERVEKIRLNYQRFNSAAEKLFAQQKRWGSDSIEQLYRLNREVQDDILALTEVGQEDISGELEVLNNQLRQTLLTVGIGTLVAAFIGIIGGSVYSRWAVGAIERLRLGVKNVGKGELAQKVHITSADEIGDLAFEFNRMVEQLRRYEKMNLENLLLEKRKAETIVQSITTPIVVVDNELRILLVNPSALRLLRKPIHTNLEGLTVTELGDGGNISELLTSVVGRVSVDESVHESTTWITEVEGKEQFYLVQVIPLRTESGVGGAIAIFSDVTEFKELDRLKSELLARISHEFRTPVSSILMSVDILREGILGEINQRQRELLDNAKDDCRRLSTMINDILEMSRLERSGKTIRLDAFNLEELVSDVMKPHQLMAEEKGIDLQVRLDPELPNLYAEPEHFRWIVNNLVSNAIKYTGGGGFVEFVATLQDDNLTIVVKDTGVGIPMDSVDMIFEKFYQVERGGERRPGSIGLGLAVVREIVEQYNGTIVVSSELNEGSVFTVRIPLANLSEGV